MFSIISHKQVIRDLIYLRNEVEDHSGVIRMKGMMLISFSKRPGAYVDVEYPEGLSKQLGFKPADINLPYSVHRMRNMRPNYTYTKVKNEMVASFFTGFDFNDFVAHPNKCIYLILEDENPNMYEGQLVKVATDLLPLFKKVDPLLTDIPTNSPQYQLRLDRFKSVFQEEYRKLVNDEIVPVDIEDVEEIRGEGSVIHTSSGTHKGKVVERKDPDIQVAEFLKRQRELKEQDKDEFEDFNKQLADMEKESLRDEIRNLQKMLESKNQQLNALEDKLQQQALQTANSAENESLKAKITELNDLINQKEKELDEWREKIVEMNEKHFVNQDTIAKMTEMTMQQSEEMQNLSRVNKDLKDAIEERDQQITSLSEIIGEKDGRIEKLESKTKDLEHAAKMSKYKQESDQSSSGRTKMFVQDADAESAELVKELEAQLKMEKAAKKALEKKVAEYKSQFVELKKTTKVQRREIQSLKSKLADKL